MEVFDVPPGQDEPAGCDFVTIDRTPSGSFTFAACVAGAHGATFVDGTYPTVEIARDQGLKWADGQGSQAVYVVDRTI